MTKDYTKYIDYIKATLDDRTKLEAFAEELAELQQATLKLIRAKGLSNNLTPKTEDEVAENFAEEISDVFMCMLVMLKCNDLESIVKLVKECPKWERWALRLGYQENN